MSDRTALRIVQSLIAIFILAFLVRMTNNSIVNQDEWKTKTINVSLINGKESKVSFKAPKDAVYYIEDIGNSRAVNLSLCMRFSDDTLFKLSTRRVIKMGVIEFKN